MARTTMIQLIALVRGLINDPVGAEMTYQDGDIQSQLDIYRTWNALAALTPLPAADGSQKQWQSDTKYWQNDVSLTDADKNELTPTVSDCIGGLFVFADSLDSVFATGWTYDPYASAAELLIMWAGRLEGEISKFSSDGSSYEFVSQAQSKLSLAATYRGRSIRYGGIRTVQMVRDDTTY